MRARARVRKGASAGPHAWVKEMFEKEKKKFVLQ